MAEWWRSPPPPLQQPYEPYPFDPYYLETPPLPVPPAVPVLLPQAQHSLPSQQHPPATMPPPPTAMPPPPTAMPPPSTAMPPPPVPMPPPPAVYMPPPKPDNPRLLRNRAEKQRRDKLNQSIAELATMVPPVVFSVKKVDKTGVLRYTAHYLRAHNYVFNPPPTENPEPPGLFSMSSTQAILSLLNGFLLTTTYKGLIVVVSQNINEYLGYNEPDLLGKSIFALVHPDDHELLRHELLPRSQPLGSHGELLVSDNYEARLEAAEALANEKRNFTIRVLKVGAQRSEPPIYVNCSVEGSFRMADHVLQGKPKCCLAVRRARARGENPYSSGNDVVFVGLVRPGAETFINESALESFRLEYRTRHSIDGEIIQSEQRLALVTGYMMEEVSGVNAMNFIHRDEVRWVITALKEMYNQNQVYGESCYRLMTKNGQFIYLRTQGRLDVDTSSQAVTSFVCTNTEVGERQGKRLIKLMKERFAAQATYQGHLPDDTKETSDSQAVEDPRKLEKEILDMVTGLPSADEINYPTTGPSRGESPQRLNIIAPKTERIVSAIDKIYTVFKTKPTTPTVEQNLMSEIEEIQPVTTVYEETPGTSYDTLVPMTPPYLEASNLPSFDTFFQPQDSGAEPSETYIPVTFPTFPESMKDESSTMANSRNEMLFPLNEASKNSIPQLEMMQSELFSPATNGMMENQVTGLNNNNVTAGVKRRPEEDQGEPSRKKTAVTTNTNDTTNTTNEQEIELDSPFNDNLREFLKEQALSAKTLDYFMSPQFVEWMTDAEIEAIMNSYRNDSGDN